jgi:hypothetical protein
MSTSTSNILKAFVSAAMALALTAVLAGSIGDSVGAQRADRSLTQAVNPATVSIASRAA